MTQKNTRRSYTQRRSPKGFTLIELLVVVLIIGILAAVAVPQYQMAVAKSRVAQLKPIWNALSKAQQVYLTQNGSYATQLDVLDIELPSGGSLSTDGRKMTYDKMECYLSGGNNSLFCKDGALDNIKLEWFFQKNKLYCWAADTPKLERLCQVLAGTKEPCTRGSNSSYGNAYCIYQ